MKIACQSCGAKYTIADEKVSGKTVKIKCKKCGATVVVDGHSSQVDAGGAADDGQAAGADEWTVSVADDDQRTLTTAQIVAEYQRGTITADTFVWKDGMAEWLALSQVPEIASAVGAVVGGVAEAPTQNAPRTPTGGGGYGYGAAPAAAAAAVPTAARTKQRAQVDLFGAGGGGAAAADAAPASTGSAHIGERNENSVLFSLSALTAAETAAKKSAPAGKSGGGRANLDMGGGSSKSSAIDDIMNLGSGSIATSASLAPPPMNAPYIEPPPPPPPPQSYHPPAMGQHGSMQQGPGSMHPGMQAMQMPMGYEQQPKKAPVGLIVGGILGVLVLAGGAFALGRGGGDDDAKKDTVAANDTTSKSKPEEPKKTDDEPKPADTAAPADTASADAKTGDAKTADATGDAKTADGKTAPTTGGAPTTPTTPAVGGPLPPSTTKKEEPKKEEPKKEEPKEEPAASATGQFDRGAAQAALGSAAGGAKGCKKEGGPTGSTKVQVTFAPSGRVTTVNVGSPFAGTPVGSCIAGAFKGLSVPAFSGSPVTVSKSVSIK